MIKNNERLGPFLNKIKACSYAKNEWIVLMDSDNFAFKDYFQIAKKYPLFENLKWLMIFAGITMCAKNLLV